MKKTWKRLCTGFLALATVVTALPTTPVHAESKQYWTESKERVGIVEKVMNDGSIGSTFNEGHLTVEGEDAYCIDINTDFKNGYKTRTDASSRMSTDQIKVIMICGIAGSLCSLIDKLFWGGSLDFLQIPTLFIFDLKDCYLTVAEVIFVVIGILHSKEISVKEYLYFVCNKFNL